MSTELSTAGILKIGTVQFTAPGLTVGDKADESSLVNFFSQLSNNPTKLDAFQEVASPQTGVTVIKTDTGEKFVTFDSSAGYKGAKSLTLSADSTKTLINDVGTKKIFGGDSNDDLAIATNSGKHVVRLGAGDDNVTIIGDSSNRIVTGDGNDTVFIGGNGNNIVRTGSGNDTITVNGDGSNRLVGGDGNDVFIVGDQANGRVTITDFKAGDILKIADRNGDGVSGLGVSKITGNASKTVITLDGGDKIVLQGVSKTEFEQKFKEGTTTDGHQEGIFTL